MPIFPEFIKRFYISSKWLISYISTLEYGSTLFNSVYGISTDNTVSLAQKIGYEILTPTTGQGLIIKKH